MIRSISGASVARALALFACGLALFACGDATTRRSAAEVRDSAGIRIVENGHARRADACRVEPTPELELGVVDGPPEHQFHLLSDAATLSNGRIAVVDGGSHQIRLFRPDGTFHSAFGGEGGGPGEFRDPSRIWVGPADTLIVGDNRPLRFSFFTAEGAFLRTVVPDPPYENPPVSAAPMRDRSFVIAQWCCWANAREWTWTERRLHLVRHGRDGVVMDTLAVLPYGRWALFDAEVYVAGPRMFEAVTRVAAADRRIVVGRAVEAELELYEIAPATEGLPMRAGVATGSSGMSAPGTLVRWESRDRTVTKADVEAYRQAEIERTLRTESADPAWYRRAGEATVSEERLVADRFPAHGPIRIGTNGDIWVREYARPRGEDEGWLVFGADGLLECRAFLPFARRWDLFEIGEDYMLGRVRDELDVEHLRRYTFARPGA